MGWWRKVIIWRKNYQEANAGQSQQPEVQMPRP
jgi:hypothetical protein